MPCTEHDLRGDFKIDIYYNVSSRLDICCAMFSQGMRPPVSASEERVGSSNDWLIWRRLSQSLAHEPIKSKIKTWNKNTTSAKEKRRSSWKDSTHVSSMGSCILSSLQAKKSTHLRCR